ncbi:hypothetical protein [Pseudobdellovibrio sp. HCB154]|uniref:hypothetical protein n=1 Tax=Pseudobdellovibrio sp. HCB154 TaxID=3386277 RepID=UPI0039173CAA
MKSFITQTLLASCLMLSLAYARDHKGPHMDEETKAAFEACAEEVGMPERESGERPTKEQHEAMKTCLEGKGIKPPKGGRPGGPPPEFRNESDASE